MNAILKPSAVPTVIGTPWEGGFYAGLISFNGDVYAQVAAPKAEGQLVNVHEWGKCGTKIPGAVSFFDGHSNTKAMAEAGLVIAERVLELRIGDGGQSPIRKVTYGRRARAVRRLPVYMIGCRGNSNG